MGAGDTLGQLSSSIEKLIASWDLVHIVTVVILILGCFVVSKIILVLIDKLLKRAKVEKGLLAFIKSLLRVGLIFLSILIVADHLGLPITSLIALFSVIGLAVSLAIQGTLSNLAGGVMVLVSKPFRVGDFVETGGVSGVVSDIGLVYTKVLTLDNKRIYVPNSEISSGKIINYSGESTRRVDVSICTAYEAPVELVKTTIQAVIHQHNLTLFTPEPIVRVAHFGESSIAYHVRVWCATADYWTVFYDMNEGIKAAFDKAHIEMTYNHLNVHIKE